MDVIRFWTWMLSFPTIWMNIMIKIRPKKPSFWSLGFGHENRDFKKQQKIKKLRKTSAVNTSIFGCEIDEQCSKSYKKYTRNQEQLPLSITTEKKCCKTQHFRPQQVQKIRGLGVAPGGDAVLLLPLLLPPLLLLIITVITITIRTTVIMILVSVLFVTVYTSQSCGCSGWFLPCLSIFCFQALQDFRVSQAWSSLKFPELQNRCHFSTSKSGCVVGCWSPTSCLIRWPPSPSA